MISYMLIPPATVRQKQLFQRFDLSHLYFSRSWRGRFSRPFPFFLSFFFHFVFFLSSISVLFSSHLISHSLLFMITKFPLCLFTPHQITISSITLFLLCLLFALSLVLFIPSYPAIIFISLILYLSLSSVAAPHLLLCFVLCCSYSSFPLPSYFSLASFHFFLPPLCLLSSVFCLSDRKVLNQMSAKAAI